MTGISPVGGAAVASSPKTGSFTASLSDTVATSDSYTPSTFAASGSLSDSVATSDLFSGPTTYNIHYSLSAWASGSYVVGNRVYVGSVSAANAVPLPVNGNVYQCTTSGTSTGAPTGTGTGINNGGTAVWKWLSTYDFNTAQDSDNYLTFVVGTITSPIIIQFWNNGLIAETITSGNGWFYLNSGIGTSATNTITITAAPGESFVDSLGANSSLPLAASASNGVCVSFANNGGNSNYVWINSPYVTVTRLQFIDPVSTSAARIFVADTGASHVTFTQCLVDCYCQSVDTIVWNAANGLATNNLVIDRSTGTVSGAILAWDSATSLRVANCSFLSINSPTGHYALYNDGVTTAGAVNVENCLLMGQTLGIAGGTSGVVVVSYCCFDLVSPGGSNIAAGTGNLYSKTQSNQYVSTTNFRLKSGSDCIDAGTTDTTDIPNSVDIIGTVRPQGSAWDIGAYEAPGGVFTGTITDSVATSDTYTASGHASGSISDTVATSDTYTSAFSVSASFSDTVAASDVYSLLASSLTLLDSVVTSDTYTASGHASGSLSENAVTSDSYTASTFAPSGALSDSIATSDAFSVSASSFFLTDSAATSDAYTASGHASGPLTDTAATSDSYTVTASSLSLTDSVATSDVYSLLASSLSLLDSLATSDTYTASTFTPSASLSDTVATSDAYTITSAVQTLTDSVATSDTYAASGQASGSLSDTAATSDSYTTSAFPAAGSFSENAVTSDSYTAATAASGSLSDSITTSDVYSLLASSLTLLDSVATSDSYTATFAISGTLSDSVATSDLYSLNSTSATLSDSVAASDQYTASTFAASGSLSDSVAASDNYTETQAASAALSDTVATSDVYSLLASSLTLLDSLATSDTYTGVLHASGALSDTVATSDSYTSVTFIGSLTDSVAASDSYFASPFTASATLTDSVATSDIYTVSSSSAALADSVATSDIYTSAAHASGALNDTVATSDAYTATPHASGLLSDSVATSDNYTGTFSASGTLADSVATSDQFGVAGLHLSDSVATSDAYSILSFAASGVLGDSIATSDLFGLENVYFGHLAETIATSDVYINLGLTEALIASVYGLPTGGAVMIEIPAYFTTRKSVTQMMISRAVSGHAGLGTFTTIYSGAPLAVFIDVGDGLPAPLNGNLFYVWKIADTLGSFQSAPIQPSSKMIWDFV